MPKRVGRDLTIGTVFTLALLILALTVMAVGGESRLFVAKSSYGVIFANVDGLRVGSPVKMAISPNTSPGSIRVPAVRERTNRMLAPPGAQVRSTRASAAGRPSGR